jgi:hypothetical protein
MTRNGIAYRLPPLVRRISGTEFLYWPTPTSLSPPKNGYNGAGNSCGLVAIMDKIKNGFLPTPVARDWRSGKGKTQAERGRSAGPSLAEVSGGQLNPQWVEWLMGFPTGWTDLEESETPSCHKLPSGSGDES